MVFNPDKPTPSFVPDEPTVIFNPNKPTPSFIPDEPIAIDELGIKTDLIKSTLPVVEVSPLKKETSFIPDKSMAIFNPNKPTPSFIPDKEPSIREKIERPGGAVRGFLKTIVESAVTAKTWDEFRKSIPEAQKLGWKNLIGEEKTQAYEIFKSIPDPQTKSGFLNLMGVAAKELPIISAEYITTPSTWILGALPIKLIGKGISKVAKATGLTKALGVGVKKELPIIGRSLQDIFTYAGTKPPAYLELKDIRQKNILIGQEKALQAAEQMSEKLSSAERLRLGQIYRGGVSVSERELPMRTIIEPIRKEVTRLGREAAGLNLLEEDTFLTNMETYMPRLYKKYEGTKKSIYDILKVKPITIKGKRFLPRQAIDEAIRTEMGEILEPAFPVAKGIAQVTRDVETAKLFKNVAQRKIWAKTPEEMFTTPKSFIKYVKMPADTKFGELSGKYVVKPIADDINSMMKINTEVGKLYNKALGWWKFGKVVANPATHFRNIMSNSILMDLSGVPHWEQAKLLTQSTKEMLNNGKYFNEAVSQDLLGHEFARAEINNMFTELSKYDETKSGLGKVLNLVKTKMGNIYQNEEKVFKLAKFISMREKGASVQTAAREAEKWLFNYEKVAPIVDYLRKSPVGAPFITFTAKALPRIVETGLTNPLRLAKYPLLIKHFENESKRMLGLTDEQYNKLKQTRRGISLLLPWKDENNAYQFLDLSYIFPWGDISESGGILGLPSTLSPSNPFTKSIAELALNKSAFTGKEIVTQAEIDIGKGVSTRADYLYKQLVPSLAPGIPVVKNGKIVEWKGGYSWDKLISAIQKRPDYWGRVRGIPAVIADIIFGIKVSPADLRMAQDQLDYEYDKHDKELNYLQQKTLFHPGIALEIKKETYKEIEEARKKAMIRYYKGNEDWRSGLKNFLEGRPPK